MLTFIAHQDMTRPATSLCKAMNAAWRWAWRVVLLAASLTAAVPVIALAQTITSEARTVSFQYDAYGTLTQQVIEPDDTRYKVTTDYVPDPVYGVVKQSTVTWLDPLTGQSKTRVEQAGYDSRYRYKETLTNAKNQVERRTYSESTGEVLTAVDANQLTTAWEYDAWGRKTKETLPEGTATTLAYRQCIDSCLNGAVTVTITQHWSGASQTSVPSEEFADTLSRQVLSRTWGFDGTAILNEKTYDALGRVEKIARPHFAGAAAVWTLYNDRDPLGRLNRISSPNKTNTGYDVTTYIYNGLSRSAKNADNQTRTQLSNALGKVKSVTDAYGWATGYVYDGYGNLLSTTDPKGNQINITYDRLGRKTSLADPNLGNNTSLIDPSLAGWTYLVDPIGQTRKQTNGNLQTTTFDFDPLGRLIHRLEQDLESYWDYDTAANGVGQLGEAYTWAAGSKDYRRVLSYDSTGRLSSSVTSLDWDYSESTTYDAFGRVDGTYHRRAARGAGASGVSNSFHPRYNAQGYVNQVDRYDGTYSTVWQAQAFDAEGHATREQLGSGLITDRGYNPYTGRLESNRTGPSSGNPSHQNDSYDYDPLGNLSSRSQLIATAGSLLSESFAYDDLNRLQSSTLGSVVKTSYYDEIGNLVSKTGVGVYSYPTSGTGSVRPNAVATITGTTAGLTNPGFSYDDNGNLKNGLGRAYAWTAYDMAASIDKLSAGSAVQRTAFIYSPEHERTRQNIGPVSGGVAGAPTTTIWYAGAIEKEIDTAANTTTLRTAMPMGLGYVEEKIAGTAIAAGASGTRNPRYFLKDHLGSTLAITDQAQAVLQRLSYDAWGRRRNPDGSDDSGPLWGSLKNSQDHSGYTGHESLDQLELVHMNARLYDPLLGRHTSADPTVPDPTNAQSLNRYSYVLNNALVFTDPTGLAGEKAEGERSDGQEGFVDQVRSACSFSAASTCATGQAVRQAQAMTDVAAVKVPQKEEGQGLLARVGNFISNVLNPFSTMAGSLTNESFMSGARRIVGTCMGDASTCGGSESTAAGLANVANQTTQAIAAAADVYLQVSASVVLEASTAVRVVKGVPTGTADVLKLKNQLASQAQMAESGTTMSGAGGRVAFRDAQRVASEHGGNAADWVKKTSSSFTDGKGTRFETHWVENIKTGQRVEFKTKFAE